MDTKGHIFDVPTDAQTPEDAIRVKGYPDPHCNQCYGRGFIKRILENISQIVLCGCLGKTNQKKAKIAYEKLSASINWLD